MPGNGRGPLGSVNVLPLQHHDESGRSVTADRGWNRRFEDPIPLPRGRCLVTLEDAGNYITKLPKAEHQAREWHETDVEGLPSNVRC
jgi:hypothetical protein